MRLKARKKKVKVYRLILISDLILDHKYSNSIIETKHLKVLEKLVLNNSVIPAYYQVSSCNKFLYLIKILLDSQLVNNRILTSPNTNHAIVLYKLKRVRTNHNNNLLSIISLVVFCLIINSLNLSKQLNKIA
jgi:hypothetical protein